MAKRPKTHFGSGSIGRLSYHPAPDEGPIETTLEFIRTQLPAWRGDPKRPQASSERLLNSALCDFLDSRARVACPMVRFKHEAPQTRARTVDIGVHGTEGTTVVGICGYSIYDPFMVVECKRLPAPSKDREREYVTGVHKATGAATGGIQRFKLGLHGADVETAAIIGYVEKGATAHWLATINRWITELAAAATSTQGCSWSLDESLARIDAKDEQDTSIAISVHHRSSICRTSSIRIYHLWIIMTSEQH